MVLQKTNSIQENKITSVRIANTNIPVKKVIGVSLTYIFGIGPSTAKKICELTKIDFTLRTNKLNKDQISSLVEECSKFKLNEDRKKEVINNIQRMVSIKCNKGIRHTRGLPVRGQNTKSNSKTSKKCKINKKI